MAHQPYKCLKCGHESQYSPSEYWDTPVTADGNPVCPKCWNDFLEAFGSKMLCTVSLRQGPSDYDRATNKDQV